MARYIEWEEIAEGGSGTIFKAYDLKEGRDVVIKKLPLAHSSMDDQFRAEWETEWEALSSLKKYVPKLYDKWEDTEGLYIVEEFIPGKTLNALFGEASNDPDNEDYGAFEDDEDEEAGRSDGEWLKLWSIIGKLLVALDYINGKGWRHGDIKTDNVMWTGSDIVLIDFGLASYRPGSAQESNVTLALLIAEVGQLGYPTGNPVQAQLAKLKKIILYKQVKALDAYKQLNEELQLTM